MFPLKINSQASLINILPTYPLIPFFHKFSLEYSQGKGNTLHFPYITIILVFDTVGCNYLPLSLIHVSGIALLIYQRSPSCHSTHWHRLQIQIFFSSSMISKDNLWRLIEKTTIGSTRSFRSGTYSTHRYELYSTRFRARILLFMFTLWREVMEKLPSWLALSQGNPSLTSLVPLQRGNKQSRISRDSRRHHANVTLH